MSIMNASFDALKIKTESSVTYHLKYVIDQLDLYFKIHKTVFFSLKFDVNKILVCGGMCIHSLMAKGYQYTLVSLRLLTGTEITLANTP